MSSSKKREVEKKDKSEGQPTIRDALLQGKCM